MKTVTALLVLFILQNARAQVGAKVDEITMPNAGGTPQTMHHCVVTKIEPDGVRVTHDAGFSKIPFLYMPEEWKKAVPHDDAKADAYNKMMKQQEKENTHRN